MDNEINAQIEQIEQPELPQKKSPFTKIIISIVLLLVVVGGGWLYYQHNQEQAIEQYKNDMSAVVLLIMSEGAKAEGMVNEYLKVWRDAIDDKFNYNNQTLHGENVWAKSTSYILHVQNKYFEKNGDVDKLLEGKTSIDNLMKNLSNPPPEYKDTYELLVSLYGDYGKLVALAEEPSGSFLSYGQDKKLSTEEIIKKVKEFNIRVPSN